MKLPGLERAFIDPAKIRDYLLSTEHIVGRHKAVVFRGMGYTREDWQRLSNDLMALALANDAQPLEANEFGQKYRVDGYLEGPRPRVMRTRTIWVVRMDEDYPRFVTAYPEA
jgi:hypothetical protein